MSASSSAVGQVGCLPETGPACRLKRMPEIGSVYAARTTWRYDRLSSARHSSLTSGHCGGRGGRSVWERMPMRCAPHSSGSPKCRSFGVSCAARVANSGPGALRSPECSRRSSTPTSGSNQTARIPERCPHCTDRATVWGHRRDRQSFRLRTAGQNAARRGAVRLRSSRGGRSALSQLKPLRSLRPELGAKAGG